MTDDPTRRNRLDGEVSPYLRAHADNPVAWQPWDETALDAGRERDVPIFLSVGYSACHWCHVMAAESFADGAVAERLNERFLPIKVDREERPDLDEIYVTLAGLVRGSAGWPLSVWLTPDGRPFHVGTYYPPESRGTTPGFRDLLDRLHASWTDDREEIERRADQWTAALRSELEATDDGRGTDVRTLDVDGGETRGVDPDLLTAAADAAVRSADRDCGGFGTGRKFPQPSRIALLLAAHDRTDRDVYRAVAVEALDALATGGVYDHVGGGFHRYAVDREWTVPHFEKMLYDNAEITRAFVDGWRVTGDDRYRRIVDETIAFLARELRGPEGGFRATLDAESDGEEGAFYVLTPDGVRSALDGTDVDPALVRDRFGITEAGNFEGATVPSIATSVADLAGEYGRDEASVAADVDTARERLRAAREKRPRPARDGKVIAGWNGLTISMLADAALAFGDQTVDAADDATYTDLARSALDAVRDRLWDPDADRLDRRYLDDDVCGPGYLDDYAFLGRGALDLYQTTGDVDALGIALALARVVERDFYDPDAGTIYFTAGDDLIVRPQETGDSSTPSSLGVALDLLTSLDAFVAHDRFRAAVEATVETHADRLRSGPLESPTAVLAADRRRTGPVELTVAGDLPGEWRDRIGTTYLPGRLLARRPADADGLAAWLDDLGIDAAPPIWADRDATGGPTVYACRSFSCSPPETDIEAALSWLDSTDTR